LKTSEGKTIIIGIEVKTGKHLDLAQIERYIFVCDFLVVAQLLQRVRVFSTGTFADNLLGSAATSCGPNLSGSAGGDLALFAQILRAVFQLKSKRHMLGY
jgi:hypothetical protein